MSSLTRYYERPEYFARLVELNHDPAARADRDRALIRALGERPTGLDILDAGCGLGGFSASLHAGNRVTGVDVNEQCLRGIAEKLGYTTQRFDLEEPWPIAAFSFDLILFGDVLEHLFSTVDVLAQARRVVRPNGRVAVAVPNVGYWRRRIRLFCNGELTREVEEHIRFFSPRSLAQAAALAGLEIMVSYPYAWNSKSECQLPIAWAWGFVSVFKPR